MESTSPVAAEKPNGNAKPNGDLKRFGRSKITNGGKLLPGIDNRSLWVRRCRDIIAAHLSDLPNISAAERSLVRRAAVLTVELETLEKKFALANAAGEDATVTDLDLYQRMVNSLRRTLETLASGLARRPKDMGTLDADGRAGAPFSPLQSRLREAFADDLIDVPAEAAE